MRQSSPLIPPAVIYLAEDVPAGLNYDGPPPLHTSQVGIVNLMDPLLEYAASPEFENGVQPVTSRPSGLSGGKLGHDLAEQSWRIDLRKGVYSRAGNELTADDVLYTFATKSVSGAAPWLVSRQRRLGGEFDTSVFDNPQSAAWEMRSANLAAIPSRCSVSTQSVVPSHSHQLCVACL